MKRLFIETKVFESLLKTLSDQGLEKRIKDQILQDPRAGDLIPGSGGLRKLRCKGTSFGSRGGYRVIYLDLPEKSKTYLFIIYKKGTKDNLSKAELNIPKTKAEKVKNE